MKKLIAVFIILASTHLSFGQNCTQKIDIPSIVNVDGDGVDDDFYVTFSCPIDEFHIVIFDRWGTQVFESKDSNFKWNCSDTNNKLIEAGTLVYKLKYMSDGKEFSDKGNFSINH